MTELKQLNSNDFNYTMIPKIIHSTGKTRSRYEVSFQNQGWEYRFYDDKAVNDFFKTHAKHLLHVIDQFKSI